MLATAVDPLIIYVCCQSLVLDKPEDTRISVLYQQKRDDILKLSNLKNI